ncbi:MAG: hypothetical protein WD314_15605 [Trueperaceae bacterium]
MLVAAFDPGRNVGFALVDQAGELLNAKILEAAELERLPLPDAARVVIGDGTGSEELRHLLERRGFTPLLVDETGSTLEARRLYFRDHPPRLPWRLLPAGMWWPPRLIDDYAAYAIALRFLQGKAGTPA